MSTSALPELTTMVGPARLAFPSLFEAREQENGGFKFGAVLLLPPSYDLKPLKRILALAVKKEKRWNGQPPEGLLTPLKDAGTKAKKYKGFEPGWTFFNVASGDRFPPQVFDMRAEPLDMMQRAQIYAGCWVKAIVNAYTWEVKGRQGVSFGFSAVQKIRDDEPLDGRVNAREHFEPVDFDSDESDDSGNEDIDFLLG